MKLVGILFVIIGVGILAKYLFKKIGYKSSVNGTVVDIYRRVLISSNGTRKATLYPIFKYSVDEEIYVKKSANGSKFCKFKIGEEVEVKYNPKNPDKYYIKGDFSNILFSLPWLIVGIAMVVLG